MSAKISAIAAKLKIIMLASTASALIISGCSAGERGYVIRCDGGETRVTSAAGSVEDVLREAGISADHADIEVSEESGETVIRVLRYPVVTVFCDGEEFMLSIKSGTVADALSALSLTLSGGDTVTPSLNEPITDGMTVTVARGAPEEAWN